MIPRADSLTPLAPLTPLTPLTPNELLERRLPSGRSMVVRMDSEGEQIEIRSPGGELDLRIVLTDAGPVVTLRGARLEVDSAEVAFRCRTFDVHATERLRVSSEGEVQIAADEMRLTAEHDIHLNGAYLRLNCTADGATPEGEALPAPEQG